MKNVPENELFSAYLDGELTAEEQAQVERMLADSPAARQLLDELRALSSTLQSLPQYKLDEDLSEAVLRHAEREILTRPVPSTPTQPSRRLPDWRRFVNSRSLAWSGMAVALAIMLMVFNSEDKSPIQLTQVTEPAAPSEVGEDRVAGGRVIEEKTTKDKAVELPSIGAVVNRDAVENNNRSLVAKALPIEESRVSTPDTPVGDVIASKGGSGRIVGPQPKHSEGLARSQKSVGKQGGPVGAIARKPAPINLQADAPVQSADMSQPDYATDVVNGSGAGAGPATTPMVGKGQGPGSDFANNASNAPPGIGPRQTLANTVDTGAPLIGTQPVNSGDQLFAGVQIAQTIAGHATVLCDISPEVLREESFVRVLGSNGIPVRETAFRRNLQFKKQGGAHAVRVDLSKELDVMESRPDGVELSLGRGFDGQTVTIDEATIAQWGDADRFDVFYVEATAAQIQATLNDLGRQNDTFLALSVKQDPGVQQQKRLNDYDYSDARDSDEYGGDRLSQTTPPATVATPEILGQQAVPTTESTPPTPEQPADRGEKAEGGFSPEAEAPEQGLSEQEEIPGKAIRGGAKSGLPARPQPTTDAPTPAHGIAGQAPESQSAAPSQPAPNAQLGLDGSLQVEPTYRVLFVLRVVGGESSGPADTAASIITQDAEPPAGPTLVDPQPSDQPAVESAPTQVPATQQ